MSVTNSFGEPVYMGGRSNREGMLLLEIFGNIIKHPSDFSVGASKRLPSVKFSATTQLCSFGKKDSPPVQCWTTIGRTCLLGSKV